MTEALVGDVDRCVRCVNGGDRWLRDDVQIPLYVLEVASATESAIAANRCSMRRELDCESFGSQASNREQACSDAWAVEYVLQPDRLLFPVDEGLANDGTRSESLYACLRLVCQCRSRRSRECSVLSEVG